MATEVKNGWGQGGVIASGGYKVSVRGVDACKRGVRDRSGMLVTGKQERKRFYSRISIYLKLRPLELRVHQREI